MFSPADKLMAVLELPSVQVTSLKSQPLTLDSATEYVPGKRLLKVFLSLKKSELSSVKEKLLRPVPEVVKEND